MIWRNPIWPTQPVLRVCINNIYISFSVPQCLHANVSNHCTCSDNGNNWSGEPRWSSQAVDSCNTSIVVILFLPPATLDTPWLLDWLLFSSIRSLLEWHLAESRHPVSTSEWMDIVVILRQLLMLMILLVEQCNIGTVWFLVLFQPILSLLHSWKLKL